MTCSVGGYGFCCSSAVLVLKMSANFSTAVVALGGFYKKIVEGTVLRRIVIMLQIASVALSCDDRDGIVTLLGNNWMVSEIFSPPLDVI